MFIVSVLERDKIFSFKFVLEMKVNCLTVQTNCCHLSHNYIYNNLQWYSFENNSNQGNINWILQRCCHAEILWHSNYKTIYFISFHASYRMAEIETMLSRITYWWLYDCTGNTGRRVLNWWYISISFGGNKICRSKKKTRGITENYCCYRVPFPMDVHYWYVLVYYS